MTWLALTLLLAGVPEDAEAAFREGRALLQAGKVDQACAAFEKSLALEEAVGTLLNLADCEARLGRTATAHGLFEKATVWAQRKGDARKEQAAKERLTTLAVSLSWVEVVAPEGAQVSIDGRPITDDTPSRRRIERALDPGLHVVAVTNANGSSWTVSVTVPRGPSHQRVEPPQPSETLPRSAAAPSPPPLEDVPLAHRLTPSPSPAPPQLLAPPKGYSTARVVAITGTYVASAALLAVGIAGIVHSVGVSNALARQQPGGPDFGNPTVTPEQVSTARWVYPLSFVGLVLGAGTAGLGTALLLTGEPAETR